MENVSMQIALKRIGAKEIELKAAYHYQYGFFLLGDRLHYINSGDDRMRKPDGSLNVYYRTAQHRKDWTGGTNQNFNALVERHGLKVTTCRAKY